MSSYRSALLAIAIASIATGCRSPWRREAAYAAQNVVIYREHAERDGARVEQGFAHPAAVSPEELAHLLRSLAYDEKPLLGGAERRAVFTPSEVERLAEPLAAALGAVRDDERVRFLVTRRSLASVVTGVSGVSGVVFQQPEGTLHVAFDAIGDGINEGDGQPDDVSFPYDPTEETYSYGLAPLEGTRLHRDPETGELHRRWVEVDVGALGRSLAEAREAGAQESDREAATAATSSPAPDPRDGVAAPAAAGPQVSGAGSDASGAADATGAAASAAPERTPPAKASGPSREERYEKVRARLQGLQRLLDEGVITEEEHRRERQKALEEL